jgi:alkylation response protein AidB-like acyl-CoA dehydrogenase
MSHNASNAANGISPGISPFTEEEELFRRTVRTFLDRELEPHYQEFEANGGVSREFWRKAAQAGLLAACRTELFATRNYESCGSQQLCRSRLATPHRF